MERDVTPATTRIIRWDLDTLKNKTAFTLAETLITLAIIGIIAALTVPNLLNKYEKHITYVKLQKYYSFLSNTAKLIENENGNFAEWNLQDNDTKSTEILANYWKPYLKYKKMCIDEVGCWSNTPTQRLNNKGALYSTKGLGDNIVIFIMEDGSNLGFDLSSTSSMIYIDLNGDKSPNTMGRDVFAFIHNDKGLFPRNKENECSTDIDIWTSGFSCAAKILQEGKINY